MSNRHLPKYKQAGYPTAWAFKQEVKRRMDSGQQQEQIASEMGVTPQYISKIAKELKRRFRNASLEPDTDTARSETSPPEVRDTDEPGPELGSPETE